MKRSIAFAALTTAVFFIATSPAFAQRGRPFSDVGLHVGQGREGVVIGDEIVTFAFVLQRDRVYVAVTTIVLGLLLFGLVFGMA